MAVRCWSGVHQFIVTPPDVRANITNITRAAKGAAQLRLRDRMAILDAEWRSPLRRLQALWSEHRDLPWPKLLDFWGLPNLRVISRDVHVVKSADEAAYRQSTRSLSLKSRVIEWNCGSRAQSPALAAHCARSYLWVWSAMVGGDDPIENPVLAMPIRPEGRPSFGQFLRLVRENTLGTYPPEAFDDGSLPAVCCGAVGSSSTNQAVFGMCCSIMLQITGSPSLPVGCLSLALATQVTFSVLFDPLRYLSRNLGRL